MRIRVNNIPYDTTSVDLREFFSRFGTVTSANVAIDPNTRQSKGFGFVEMSDENQARNAIAAAHGKMVKGRRVTAEESPVYQGRDGRFGARGGFRY
jgi:cold-inducible RNA-binding protein